MENKVKKFAQFIVLSIIFCLLSVHNLLAYEAEINKLSATMAEKIAVMKKAKVAVVDFTDLQGDVTELGRFIAEELSVALASLSKSFKVVDRIHLKSIIKENNLSATGIIDPATARKLGKIVGVDALVTGSLTPFGDSVRISVKILDTITAEIIDADRVNIAKTEAIKALLATSVSLVPPVSPEPIGTPLQTAKGGSFIFQLVSCKLSNGNITASFVITNQDKDKLLVMYGNKYSKIFDFEGNEYGAGEVQIANSQEDNSRLKKRLISGIPTNASITFKGIPSKIKGIKLLEIRCRKFTLQFRNVPLSA
ncbi:TolB amino-terminal domain-containing protein [Candidatus Magnetomoraceae bacterium gMMP-15]